MNDHAEVSLNDIHALIKKLETTLTGKIDEINKDIKKFTQTVNHEVSNLDKRVEELALANEYLKRRLKSNERQLKKNNLIFYGVNEEENENSQNLKEHVITLLNSKLQLELEYIEIIDIHRIGKKTEKTRPILAQFLSNITKREIIWQKTNLKGTKIYVSEDLIAEDKEKHKILVENLKKARQEQKHAYIKGKVLVIEDTYTHQELTQDIDLEAQYNIPVITSRSQQNIFTTPTTPIPKNQEQDINPKPLKNITKEDQQIITNTGVIQERIFSISEYKKQEGKSKEETKTKPKQNPVVLTRSSSRNRK